MTIARCAPHALTAAVRFAPAASLVGYRQGDSPARMKAFGFTEIGALRVWTRG